MRVGVALVAWLLFAVVPLSRLPLRDVRGGLTDGGRTAAGLTWRRLGSSLVVLELATALLLLAGAGLLTRSLYRLLHVEIGVRTDHLAMLSVAGPPAAYDTDEKSIALEKEVLRRMESLPGVRSAAVTTYLPLSWQWSVQRFHGDGAADCGLASMTRRRGARSRRHTLRPSVRRCCADAPSPTMTA